MKDYDPIEALKTNVERLVRAELNLSNKAAAAKFGIGEGSVQNFIDGNHLTTIRNLAGVAAGSGAPLWQVFLPAMPDDKKSRALLDEIVGVALDLSDDDRKVLLKQAKFLRSEATKSEKTPELPADRPHLERERRRAP